MTTTEDQQRHLRELNARRRELQGKPSDPRGPDEPARRLSLSETLRLVLERGSRSEGSYVELVRKSRTGRGDVEITVKAYSETVADAGTAAQAELDRLELAYPRVTDDVKPA